MEYLKREDDFFDSEGEKTSTVSGYAFGFRDPVNKGHVLSHIYAEVFHIPRKEFLFYDNANSHGYPIRYYHENDQMELFSHKISPASSEVGYVNSTKSGRLHFPLIMGIANNDAMRITGTPLRPSDDLSEHSLRAVENLRNRGLIDDSVDIPDSPTNDMTFSRFAFHVIPGNYKKIPEQEVRAGKQTIRELLRRKKNLSTQFDSVEHSQNEKHTQLELDL